MRLRSSCRLVTLFALLLMAVPTVAHASPFTVSNLNDSGRGSLRRAIQQANYYNGQNLVRFASGLSGTITLTSGPITVSNRLNIQGPGASGLSLKRWRQAAGLQRLRGLAPAFRRDDPRRTGRPRWGNLAGCGRTAQISNCTFTGNLATDGGGIFATQSHLSVTGCTFTNNTALHGGGIYADRAPLTVIGGTFAGNQTFYAGSGVFAIGAAATVDHCAFIGNQTADAALALAYAPNEQSVVTNCLFDGNFNPGTGAILVFNEAHATITNCTVAGTTGGITTGSGISVVTGIRGAATATIANTIVWGNTSFAGPVGEVVNVGNSSGSIAYSDIEGTVSSAFTTDHPISADPQFVRNPDGSATPPDPGDLHVKAGSPAIDAGQQRAPARRPHAGPGRPPAHRGRRRRHGRL